MNLPSVELAPVEVAFLVVGMGVVAFLVAMGVWMVVCSSVVVFSLVEIRGLETVVRVVASVVAGAEVSSAEVVSAAEVSAAEVSASVLEGRVPVPS